MLASVLMDRLQALAIEEATTLFVVLLAGFRLLLFRLTDLADIAVGCPTTVGREEQQARGLIGPLANMLLLRTDVSGAPTFRQLVRRERDVVLGAFAHAGMRLTALRWVRTRILFAGQSPFQAVFAMHTSSFSQFELPGVRITLIEGGLGTSRLDLALHIGPWSDEWSATFECSLDLYDPITIQRIADSYQSLLDYVARAPDAVVQTCPLADGLAEWVRTAQRIHTLTSA
jgi:non-ribosomal peptide synthetase component F